MNQYFIDTNYFLRILLKDVEEHFDEAYLLFSQGAAGTVSLFTSTLVFFEIAWVLSSFYKTDKAQLIIMLKKILDLEWIEIEHRELLEKALILFSKTSLDLPDCYNIYYSKQGSGSSFATFDKKILSQLKKKDLI